MPSDVKIMFTLCPKVKIESEREQPWRQREEFVIGAASSRTLRRERDEAMKAKERARTRA